jgi:hypothetical protein
MPTPRDGKKVPSHSTKSREATIAPMRARRGDEAERDGEVSAAPTPSSADARAAEIAAQAYFLAEARGFAPGHELEDWLAAEQLVDDRAAGAPRS